MQQNRKISERIYLCKLPLIDTHTFIAKIVFMKYDFQWLDVFKNMLT